MTKKEIKTNKEHWDCRSDYHVEQSKKTPSATAYRIESFINGQNTLSPCDLDALKKVKGKKLLHLQCHIGLDTLSWARMGAKVTGTDLSGKAIKYAQELAIKTRLKARFFESDVYTLPQVLSGRFDIVYTSRGVLMWLPDLDAWAKIVARYLKPNGVFFLHEEHPLMDCFEAEETPNGPKMVAAHSYYESGATEYESGTYTNRKAVLKQPKNYQWHHKLSDIVTSLAKAGLMIDEMKEFQEGFYKRYPQQEERAQDGCWRLPSSFSLLPLAFSIKAHKVRK